MVVNLMLVNDVAHCLGPEAVLKQDGFHFLNEDVVEGDACDLLSIGDWDKSGDCNECNLHLGILPVCIFH